MAFGMMKRESSEFLLAPNRAVKTQLDIGRYGFPGRLT